MDNAYFIGYRIDIDTEDDWIDMQEEACKEGHSVGYLPGEEWYSFPKRGGGVSFLWMDKDHSDYRCPIDREELWEDLHETTLDFPFEGAIKLMEIRSTKLYKHLVNKYGSEKIKARWGIFLCLG